MRHLIAALTLMVTFSSVGCVVKVEDKPAPIVKRERKVDVKVKTPAVDVNVDKRSSALASVAA